MTSSPLSDRTQQALASRITREQADRRLPSIVAGVVTRAATPSAGGVSDGGAGPARLVWSTGAGSVDGAPPTADTQYRIGSITKTVTAVAVLRLRDDGLIDLGDPLDRHVDAPAHGPTIAQLLTHTGGLSAETEGPWWERVEGMDWPTFLRRGLGADARRHPAGDRFHYSNVGFTLLGRLVAEVRGASWWDVVASEILHPLGMDRTTYDPAPPHAPGLAVHPHADVTLAEEVVDLGVMAPAGQLWSTIGDLARWAGFLAGGHADVLAADTIADMRRPRALSDVADEPWTTAHGLGLQVHNVDGRRAVGHGGSVPGFVAVVQVEPTSGTGIAVACNATSGVGPDLVADLGRIVGEQEPVEPTPWTPSPIPRDVLAIAGRWYWATTPLTLHVESADRLRLGPTEAGTARASRFVRGADGVWTGLDGYYDGEPLRVVADDHGRVTHLDVASFVLTRLPYEPADVIPGGVDPRGWGLGPW